MAGSCLFSTCPMWHTLPWKSMTIVPGVKALWLNSHLHWRAICIHLTNLATGYCGYRQICIIEYEAKKKIDCLIMMLCQHAMITRVLVPLLCMHNAMHNVCIYCISQALRNKFAICKLLQSEPVLQYLISKQILLPHFLHDTRLQVQCRHDMGNLQLIHVHWVWSSTAAHFSY